jgi:hypothetical protein
MIDQYAWMGQIFHANRPDHLQASGEQPWLPGILAVAALGWTVFDEVRLRRVAG